MWLYLASLSVQWGTQPPSLTSERWSFPMSDLSGRRLGQYEILEAIGQGGMASVYKARQESMDRDVAIKVIIAQLADNADFITRFEREARLIAKLQHPH